MQAQIPSAVFGRGRDAGEDVPARPGTRRAAPPAGARDGPRPGPDAAVGLGAGAGQSGRGGLAARAGRAIASSHSRR